MIVDVHEPNVYGVGQVYKILRYKVDTSFDYENEHPTIGEQKTFANTLYIHT